MTSASPGRQPAQRGLGALIEHLLGQLAQSREDSARRVAEMRYCQEISRQEIAMRLARYRQEVLLDQEKANAGVMSGGARGLRS